jgi:hypothetical protein
VTRIGYSSARPASWKPVHQATRHAPASTRFCGKAGRQGFARASRWRGLTDLTLPRRACAKAGVSKKGVHHVRSVAHTHHHSDDRPSHADLLRVRHYGPDRARFAGDGHPARGHVCRRREPRGRGNRLRQQPWLDAGTARPRRCDGARVATRQVSRRSAPAPPSRSRARGPQHPPAVVVATAGPRRAARWRRDSRTSSLGVHRSP